MLRVADEKRLPFEVKVPNATTRKAMAELESGRGKRFASVDNLMKDLHAGDALTALGRKIGPTNKDFAALEQDRDKAPAEPARFE
ncbi:MAG: type II toxin-antitoxin system RelB/DinJ family antitoxin [Betaproteobacteria bacterium]|nr:type II toxin-antitoxin system RelB/DinJ family antitoxin [Betaproteobacteria bacterium]